MDGWTDGWTDAWRRGKLALNASIASIIFPEGTLNDGLHAHER